MAHVPTDVRRQQFIDAAVVVVGQVGVDGATTRRIAEQAGAPLATLHYCFGTKEALLWAALEQLAESVRSEIEASGAPGRLLSAEAGRLLRETILWSVRHRDHNQALIEVWLWAERNDKALAMRIYEDYVESFKEVLRRVADPLPEDELETVLQVVVALVDGLSMQLATQGDEHLVLRDAETAVAVLQSYLQATRSDPTSPVAAGNGRKPSWQPV